MTRPTGYLLAMAAFTALATLPGQGQAAEPECELDRPVVFAGLDWDSNAFHNAVARFIVENGYGCRTDEIPGSTLPLLAGMGRGDIDVTMEIWEDNIREAWDEMTSEGKVANLGVNFPDAEQGWYVPRYLVEGENAEAPELRNVADLPKYKDLFTDPEEPSKGRFYNCILGWSCEVVNTKKLHAYGLLDDYTNFRPGTGAALAAAIASNYKRQKPFVAFYWSPTWVMGQYDLVKLDEPAYDEEIWKTLTDAEAPDAVEKATAYPTAEVMVGVNAGFRDAAPQLVEFLSRYETTSALVSKALSYMEETGATTGEAAEAFLEENGDVWTQWVPDDVAKRVEAALAGA